MNDLQQILQLSLKISTNIMQYFVISGYIPSEETDSEKKLVFWTKTGWSVDIKYAKKYRSEKIVKNAISKMSNSVFINAVEVEVKVQMSPLKPEKRKHTKTSYCHNYPPELHSGKVSYHYCYPHEFDGDEDWSEDDDHQRHQGKVY